MVLWSLSTQDCVTNMHSNENVFSLRHSRVCYSIHSMTFKIEFLAHSFKWKICQFIKAFKIEFDCFKFQGIQECVWILILVATFIQGKMISHSSSFLSKLKSSSVLHCRFPHTCNKKVWLKLKDLHHELMFL